MSRPRAARNRPATTRGSLTVRRVDLATGEVLDVREVPNREATKADYRAVSAWDCRAERHRYGRGA